MKKLHLIVSLLIAVNSFAQPGRGLSTYLSFQGNQTLYDRTKSNNSSGMGFGLLALLNTKAKVKPTLEVTGDLFYGTKELLLTPDGIPIDSKNGVLGIYAGPMFQPLGEFFITTAAGVSIYNGKAHFGLRPAIGVGAFNNRVVMAKLSFTNVFQNDITGSESFGYLCFSFGIRLF